MTGSARMCACLIFICLSAGAATAGSIAGSYSGRYKCGRWNTLELTIRDAGDGRLSAVFTFPLTGAGRSQGLGSYALTGQYDARSGRFRLQPQRWVGPQPPGYGMVGMDGTFDPASQRLTGKIMGFTCGAFELALGAGGAAIAQSVPAPPSVLPAERRTTPSNVSDAWMTGGFEYWDAAMSDGKGPVRESEPIDDVFDRLRSEQFSCVGTRHVSWDGSGTKGTAMDRVSVSERFVVECDGDCRGLRYTPRVAATVIHFGASSPAPMLQIKSAWLGGTDIRWDFTRAAGAPPPDVYVHRWTAGTFNTGSPGCRPPKSDNR